MRFEQVQRFILAKKIFWGEGHFKFRLCAQVTLSALCRFITLCIQIVLLHHNNNNNNNNNTVLKNALYISFNAFT